MPQYPPNYYNQYYPQVQPPMDRLAQLQAQQYPQMQPAQQPQQMNQGILYVQGEAGAKSWMVAANSTVLLMDSENPVFYLKSADPSGIPLPLRIFDYQERTQGTQEPQRQPEINMDDKYVTRKEYDDLQSKYMDILDRLNNFPVPGVAAKDGKRTTSTASKTGNRGGNADE